MAGNGRSNKKRNLRLLAGDSRLKDFGEIHNGLFKSF